jgi:hypothetical protein
MKYLTYVLFLLVIGSSIYSLKYEKHELVLMGILFSLTNLALGP